MSAPQAQEKVLSTLNQDGTRFKIRPRPAKGRFWVRRAIVGYGLIALFVALPLIRIGGKPGMLLDLGRREFVLLGASFRPSDGFMLMLFGLTIVLTVFLITALFGRAWCGWGCPQTVYLEFVFRPIERLLEGNPSEIRRRDKDGIDGRRVLKWAIYLVLAFLLANVFLSYFVGTERLFRWITTSPAKHPFGFGVVVFVTGMMFFDFAWFREQTCIVACPYGRLQSVLLDKQSLIVGYDSKRGEPRGKPGKKLPVLQDAPAAATHGACIDCKACVQVCPTGIDIRDGLQMECVSCTQCIDACDEIMDKVGQPRGLIRYTSQDELAGVGRHMLRARTMIYPTILAAVFGLLVYSLGHRTPVEVTVLRQTGAPFQMLADGRVSTSIRIKLENRTDATRVYRVTLDGEPADALVTPQPEVTIKAGAAQVVPLFIMSDGKAFTRGKRKAHVSVRDDLGTHRTVTLTLLGPEGDRS